jgi:hypothetical protein
MIVARKISNNSGHYKAKVGKSLDYYLRYNVIVFWNKA